jgi:hypothetical protein
MLADLIAAVRQLTRLSMLLAVGVVAAIVPTYRATTVDPIVVLREP